MLNVDYLIDDTPQHFAGLNGVGLLFDAPHNRGDESHYRVRGWREVPAAIALHEGKAKNAAENSVIATNRRVPHISQE